MDGTPAGRADTTARGLGTQASIRSRLLGWRCQSGGRGVEPTDQTQGHKASGPLGSGPCRDHHADHRSGPLTASQGSSGASPGCITTPRTCGGCCAIAWTGACNAPPAAPKSATSRRSASGSPATGPGPKKRQAPQGRHLLLRRVRRFADPDRALDLGAPRQDPGAGPPVQLEARLDRRRVVLGSNGGGCQLAFHVQPGSYHTDSLIGVLGELRRFLGGQKATLAVGWAGCPSQQQAAGVHCQPAPLAGGGAAARLCP